MERYFFVKNINDTGESGIVDFETTKCLCLCDEESSKVILDALNQAKNISFQPPVMRSAFEAVENEIESFIAATDNQMLIKAHKVDLDIVRRHKKHYA